MLCKALNLASSLFVTPKNCVRMYNASIEGLKMLFTHKFALPVAVSVGILERKLFSELLCLGIAVFHILWLA